MSSITTYCATCGNALDPASEGYCPHCEVKGEPALAREESGWGPGTGLIVWLSSVLLIFGFQFLAIMVYFVISLIQTGELPKSLEINWLVTMLSIGSTFPAHIATLVVCWLVVTARGQRPFWQTLGWGWHPQFKWVHAVALAFLMMGVALLFERILPHQETDLERLLKFGPSIRILVAALAVITAPLVEEVVYRGILYPGIERKWGKVAGVVVVTLLFALVHVPQYRSSVAAVTAILSLSLVLTLLRALTGKLLPCVATHLVYNAVQAVALIAAPEQMDRMPDNSLPKTASFIFCQWLGIG
jgi:CAAX protease family protein